MCDRTGGGAAGRWALCCGLRRGGAGASDDGAEQGGGAGSCCRGSSLVGRAMAGLANPTDPMPSAAEEGWLSAGSGALSFPGAEAAPGSVLLGGMWGCETGPTGCWGASVLAAVELWCAGEPVPRMALAPASAVAAAADTGAAPEGLGSAVKSCLRTDDGVGLLGCGL